MSCDDWEGVQRAGLGQSLGAVGCGVILTGLWDVTGLGKIPAPFPQYLTWNVSSMLPIPPWGGDSSKKHRVPRPLQTPHLQLSSVSRNTVPGVQVEKVSITHAGPGCSLQA